MINREGARMHELKRAEKRGHSILGKPKPAHNNLLLTCFFLVYSSVCYLKQCISILILRRQTQVLFGKCPIMLEGRRAIAVAVIKLAAAAAAEIVVGITYNPKLL